MAATMRWNDVELGKAIDARDYDRVQRLVDAGHDLSQCVYCINPNHSMFPPHSYSALYYVVKNMDIDMLKLFLKNNVKIEQHVNKFGGGIVLFYRDRSAEVFELLCNESYQQIMNDTIKVYPEMIKGLIEYFGITRDGFVYKELIAAADFGDTQAARRILLYLISQNIKGGFNHEKAKS